MLKSFNQYVYWCVETMKFNKFGIPIEAWTYKECMIPWHFQYDYFTFLLPFSLIKKSNNVISFVFMFPIFPSKTSKSNLIINKLIPSFLLQPFYCSNSKILTSFPWNMVYNTKTLCCHMYHILFYLWLKYETIWTIFFSSFFE
jgi:hypothetical protein